jgi:hypothetical protein
MFGPTKGNVMELTSAPQRARIHRYEVEYLSMKAGDFSGNICGVLHRISMYQASKNAQKSALVSVFYDGRIVKDFVHEYCPVGVEICRMEGVRDRRAPHSSP